VRVRVWFGMLVHQVLPEVVVRSCNMRDVGTIDGTDEASGAAVSGELLAGRRSEERSDNIVLIIVVVVIIIVVVVVVVARQMVGRLVVQSRMESRLMEAGQRVARLVVARQRVDRLVVACVLRSVLEFPGELEARRLVVAGRMVG
jgi:hypothetical protein